MGSIASKRGYRLLTLAFASLLGIALSFPVGATAHAAQTSDRIAGGTAEETSAEISKSAFPTGTDTGYAIIARSDDFADAMSATGLAGALDCPIVTTSPDEPSEAMLNEVKRLGARNVFIIGGSGAITPAVEESLGKLGVKSERIFGENSWDTSVKCAEAIKTYGGNPNGDVIVATSGNFQDALSISSFAFKYKVPIILGTSSFGLTDDAKKIVSGASGKVYVPGGVAAVPRSSAEDLVGAGKVVRLAGKTGYDTSNQIATYLTKHGLLGVDSVFVATGALATKGVDALSGAILAGKNNAAIVLVSGNSSIETTDTTTVSGKDSEGTVSFLEAHAGTISTSIVLGGTSVVPDTVKVTIEVTIKENSKPEEDSSTNSGSNASSSPIAADLAAPVEVKESPEGFKYAIGTYLLAYDEQVRSGDLPDGHKMLPGSEIRVPVPGKKVGTVYYFGSACGEGAYILGYTGTGSEDTGTGSEGSASDSENRGDSDGSADSKDLVKASENCVKVPEKLDGYPVVFFTNDQRTHATFDFSDATSLKCIMLHDGTCSGSLESLKDLTCYAGKGMLPKLSPASIERIDCRGMSNEKLDLTGATNLKQLHLYVDEDSNFYDKSLPIILENCPNLELINTNFDIPDLDSFNNCPVKKLDRIEYSQDYVEWWWEAKS